MADASSADASPSDPERLLLKVRNLMRRITAARSSPHPRFLHNLAAILEREESRFEKDVGHSTSSNARSTYSIGRLATLIRENDEFSELLARKLLVESKHSIAVRAAAARLLLSCLSCGMYPDVFGELLLANIKEWVIEDMPKLGVEAPSPSKPGFTGAVKLRKRASADWEMLRTYSTGLLAVALTVGEGVVEEVLATGVAAKLMHYLRSRVFKEGINHKEVVCSSTVRNKDDLRSRARFPSETSRVDTMRDMGESSENEARDRERLPPGELAMEQGILEDKEAIGSRAGPGSLLEKHSYVYDADDDADWTTDEKWQKKDGRDGKSRNMDPSCANRAGRDDEVEETGTGEPSKRRGDIRDRGSTRFKEKGRVNDGTVDGDKSLTSPRAGVRTCSKSDKSRGQREKNIHKFDAEGDLSKVMDATNDLANIDCTVPESEREDDEQEEFPIIGGIDISVPVRKAARAAKAEAKAAKASHQAVKAAGEAATDLVKAAALEALGDSFDKEAALAAAISAAEAVVNAAAATEAIRNDIDLSSSLEAFEEKDGAEIELAELGDCILDAEALADLRERFCVQCLERLGEYLEVLGPVLHERGVDVCLALLQRESADEVHTKDKAILADVLKLICALAAHRKFSALFVDRGGVQQILAVPRVSQTYTGISLCLFAFASVQGVMERVCTAPVEVVNEVVNLALTLLECTQDSTRRNSALFFGAAFVFRAILDAFDAQDGLSKMLNLLQHAATIRSGGGSSSTSRIDRAASAEVLTSSEKQIAYHTCVALRQYFRAHLLILADSLRPYKGKGGSRNPMSGQAAYKPLDLSNEAMDTLLLQLQRDRKLGPAFVRARWHALEKFINYSGHIILLELIQVAPGEKYLYERAQHALGVLQIITLMPYARRLVVSASLSNERSGMAVILDAASATGFGEPEVIQSALLVLVNLVCPPPSLSSRLVLPGNTASGNGNSSLEGRERPVKGEGIPDKTSGDRPSQAAISLNDTKERPSRGDGNPEKIGTGALPSNRVQSVGTTSPAGAVVGDRRISLGPAAGGSGLAAYMEQGYRLAREVVRANNGIKVLLQLLYPRTLLPPTSQDCIRALACRVLLGLARDDAIAHILTKLQVGKLLSELLRDGSSHVGCTAVATGTGEQGRWQSELGQVSMELIAIVTNAGRASTLVASDAAAPTLRRIERAAIAAATPISYPARELLQLIHEHLVMSGLVDSASALLKEAQLVPLASASSQTSFPSQNYAVQVPLEPWPWPAGRVVNGFSVEASKLLRENESGCKSDQLPGSTRKKGPSFSSSLITGQWAFQTAASSGKKTSKDITNMDAKNEKGEECQISEALTHSNSESGDPLSTPSTSCLPVKRRISDRDTLSLPTNKRIAIGDFGGLLPAFMPPFCSKNSQVHYGTSSLGQGQGDAISQPFPSMLEKPELTVLCNDNISNVDSHQSQMHHFPTTANHMQASALPHANLLSGPQSCQNERATLDSLVVQYLKHQHRQCPMPITTLPPLSLFHTHVCPEPSRACYAPLNMSGRLVAREMVPPYGGSQGRRRDRHFVYSRFRPLRPCKDDGVLLTSTTFLGTTFRLAAGSHAGEIRVFDCHSGNLLETHLCHQSAITSLQSNFRDLGSSVEFTGSELGHLLLSSGSFDARLWNSSALGDVPLHSFDRCRCARFNHSGNMLAAISTEAHREVLLYDVQTGKLEQRLVSDSSLAGVLRGSPQSIVHFNPSDTLLLWNGVLWDHRVPRAIHRFDQFTDYGGGSFHPAGNEVIINSEVWDLRAFKLLRSVPSLDQTVITFNATGDVIYATLRRNSEDITSALHPRRGRHPLFAAFRTMDAVDYTDIATTSVDRCVLDLATEPTDSLISVVALDGHEEMDSLAKLYEVGRRKPTDDDSDPDDGVETEDDEDSLAEDEAVEEEDLHGDGDESELDGSDDGDGSGDEEDAEEDVDADFDTNDEDDDDDTVEVDGSIVELISDGEGDETRISYSSGDDGSLGEFDEDFRMLGFF